MDTQSDLDIPKQKVERVFSEDIDGPSDFTQNMDMWMRGGTMSKGTLRGSRKMPRPIQEEDEAQHNDHLAVPEAGDAEEKTESHHTPDSSPPKVSVLDQTTHEDQFSSEWHTHGSHSTPVPPVHKQFLQPTVEDYYSELTPAHRTPGQYTRGRPPQKHSPAKDEDSTPGRASSPTLSPVRSPIIQRTAGQDEDYPDEEKHELERQLSALSAKCQQLEHLNDALGQALDEDRRIRKQEAADHEAKLAEAARRERDLAEMKEAAYQHNDGFRREFGDLKEKLREQERQAETERVGNEDSKQDLQAELLRLRERMEVDKMEHNQQIRALEQDLELARRGRDNAEETARVHREELEEQNEIHQEEVARFREELKDARDTQTAVKMLEARLKEANEHMATLRAANGEANKTILSLRAKLSKAKQGNDEETQVAVADRSRAVEFAANLQRQLHELKQQLKDEQSAHEEEMEQLKWRHAQGRETSQDELEVVRAELEAKQTELNEAILERDEAKDSLQSRESTEADLQAEIDDMKLVNAELDARITEKMQRREKYWREKLEEADKERALMAKALLHQWGREEVGIESPQMYAYKYLKKGSIPVETSPSKATVVG
ncbi:hypothetical protein M409DRAFT_49174 [Zasmidium cellare ATCC 36951]|uniref:Uncharacterized protein n=1 Tax=Zasmidium cellare ATCC 36951 TaxID=1080233 RepID=A0A6A6CZT9_ZASCE|nr:uncharacterized protein M409DRAFT_49174 [Zasmidium cellare ATCC 36951]KAF2172621.1 hypothetical protein M409DRAFT_49174 [Zasmidium cellare ATCC 36951]